MVHEWGGLRPRMVQVPARAGRGLAWRARRVASGARKSRRRPRARGDGGPGAGRDGAGAARASERHHRRGRVADARVRGALALAGLVVGIEGHLELGGRVRQHLRGGAAGGGAAWVSRKRARRQRGRAEAMSRQLGRVDGRQAESQRAPPAPGPRLTLSSTPMGCRPQMVLWYSAWYSANALGSPWGWVLGGRGAGGGLGGRAGAREVGAREVGGARGRSSGARGRRRRRRGRQNRGPTFSITLMPSSSSHWIDFQIGPLLLS
jgi:hypothetical protein